MINVLAVILSVVYTIVLLLSVGIYTYSQLKKTRVSVINFYVSWILFIAAVLVLLSTAIVFIYHLSFYAYFTAFFIDFALCILAARLILSLSLNPPQA